MVGWRLLCLSLLFISLAARDAGSAEETAAAKQPPLNVVIFLVDDLGWKDVGCYGSEFYDTPNIDQLASAGCRFTDAYAACHVCSPTRASILTGQYPARLKLTDWLPGRREFPFQRLRNAEIHDALPLEHLTLAEVLRERGYRTGHFGKWHLGEDPFGPLEQGFEQRVPTWNKGWPKQGYHAPFDLAGIEDEPGEYLTDRLTDEAVQFMEEHAEEPFFLYLSHFAVHDPIQGRSDLVEKYKSRRNALPETINPFLLEGNPDRDRPFTQDERRAMISEPRFKKHAVLPDQIVKIKQRQDNPEFAAMVEAMDESLGRVVGTLSRLGLRERTLIIFTSDNGGMAAANFGRPSRVVAPNRLDAAYSTSNLPLRGAKGWLYEGGIRVPLIIDVPGTVVDQAKSVKEDATPVISADLFPTVLDTIGSKLMPTVHLDGCSLLPILRGAELDREALYWHFPHYSNHGMQSPGGAIRAGKYKLLEYFENGTLQLFDLEQDPAEQHDLVGEMPELAAEMRQKLIAWRKEVNAEMMPVNPEFDPRATVNDPAR